MRLDETESWARLAAADHGVLATRHSERGVDVVPIVFAVDGDLLGIPVDTVKPKASTRLQRERNLAADPRATVLVEHWDAEDWSALWWVRAELRWEATPPPATIEALTAGLVSKYPAYAGRPFASVLVLRSVAVVGWSAGRAH
ncbi:MAG: pyridoxamine 5'-phosphate oxidase family protein [Phycicoccus sp.]|nr:pyridoxamine 5'-phosphate oxidase family protein [Phycicoccus sp.]